jgi:lysophospholipase L1-like esterase
MNWETLMSFGDSITIGARSYCGYPEYAGNFLEKSLGNKWNVINHAVSGYTTINLARYITANFSNLHQFAPGIITIMIGTNDVKFSTAESDFEIAYRQVVLKALMIAPNKNVLLIKIPSFPKNVAYPYQYKMNETVIKFNAIIEKIAADFKIRVTSFSISEEDLFDGVHLDTTGSINAAKQLAHFIEADKGLDRSDEIPVTNLPPDTTHA